MYENTKDIVLILNCSPFAQSPSDLTQTIKKAHLFSFICIPPFVIGTYKIRGNQYKDNGLYLDSPH